MAKRFGLTQTETDMLLMCPKIKPFCIWKSWLLWSMLFVANFSLCLILFLQRRVWEIWSGVRGTHAAGHSLRLPARWAALLQLLHITVDQHEYIYQRTTMLLLIHSFRQSQHQEYELFVLSFVIILKYDLRLSCCFHEVRGSHYIHTKRTPFTHMTQM